ncbi:sensor domain-containing diguanylate cyclase [Desulforamulus aquiferis]|uniref:Sensor domain-containing diguanylate cyclase n=1 Tax=Desulforamulus aquiferis TaxID=1397668 RepID=A0AAW7ZA72_9FIRM|nr:sensor domain-containing diguanylate cyclase [Desulforamulus aquiferis]MDO7786310.1 sensor domain-containing diguanylate cyclase [Desulforamulus aquiferis]
MDFENSFYKDLLDNLYDGVYFVDRDRRITYWNQGAERLTGYSSEEVLGKVCSDNILMHLNNECVLMCLDLCPVAETMIDGQKREAELYLHHKEGYRVPVLVRVAPIMKEGQIVGAVEVFSDNSSKVSALERIDALKRAIYSDPLTGLANRTFIEISLTTNLQELQKYDYTFGLMFLDVDKFKTVNDSYGHNVGDEVLKMVAKTLLNGCRPLDIIGRWAGDEFVIVLTDTSQQNLQDSANKLSTLIEQSSITRKSAVISVTASIGVTLARAEDSIEELISRADRLMYQSKKTGGNRVSIG